MVKLISKNSNLCDHNPPTSQTDGQTDRQTTCDGNTALCTKVHRAVKTQFGLKGLKHKEMSQRSMLVNQKSFEFPKVGSVAEFECLPGDCSTEEKRQQ